MAVVDDDDSPDKFKYLPYLIPYLFVLLSIFMFVIYYYQRREYFKRESASVLHRFEQQLQNIFGSEQLRYSTDVDSSPTDSTITARNFFNTSNNKNSNSNSNSNSGNSNNNAYENHSAYQFEKAFYGVNNNSVTSLLLLLVIRLLFFVYFFSIDFIINLEKNNISNYMKYFTNWNCVLITVYYSLALFSSFIGTFYTIRGNNERWSPIVEMLGYFQYLVFHFGGATALMVTVVAFSLLDSKMYFWNLSVHLFTTISYIVELSLNSFYIQLKYVYLMIGWALLYMIVLWPLVVKDIYNWPYEFLRVDKPICFLWYTGLFIGCCIFYIIWYSLSRLKSSLVLKYINLNGSYGNSNNVNTSNNNLKVSLLLNDDFNSTNKSIIF